MNLSVHFEDGFCGGHLTTDHPRSNYGLPVFVADGRYPPAFYALRTGQCYGPEELKNQPQFVIDNYGEMTRDEYDAIIRAGFRIRA